MAIDETLADPPTLRPFSDGALEPVLDFVRAHPLVPHDGALLRSLLTTLPRSPAHVLDLHLRERRVLVACVLDTMTNASNSAVLEILGLCDGPQAAELLAFTVAAAERLVRAGPVPRLEVSLPGPLARHTPLLQQRGYRIAHCHYHMIRDGADPAEPPPPLASGWRFADAGLADLPAYHALLVAAFADIPGAQISDFAGFRAMFEQTPRRPRLLFHGDRLIGFVKTTVDPDGVTGLVNTIGRDPALRGQRLGDLLLWEAARVLARDGARRLRLEVSTSNRSALDLYLRHGFRVAVEEPTYQRNLDAPAQ